MFFTCRRWIGLALSLILGFVLSACELAGLTEANQRPTRAAPAQSAQDTPTAVTEQQEYTSQDFGFSLSYPAGFEVQGSFPHTIVFLAPQGTPGHRERAILSVELTFDQSAEWYANQAKAENAYLGTGITASTEVLDGEQAYILGRLPGQDLNRQVFSVKDGVLYHLMFMPDDPAAGEDYQQMEAVYTAVIKSLRFLPERRAVPPVTNMSNMIHQLELALNARSADDIARLLGDEVALGYLRSDTPEPLTFAAHVQADAIPLILNEHLSPTPAVTLQYQVDWASVPGSLDTYAGYFPDEVITPILARGWGPNGTDQAVLLIARRIDGSLFWRGAFILQ